MPEINKVFNFPVKESSGVELNQAEIDSCPVLKHMQTVGFDVACKRIYQAFGPDCLEAIDTGKLPETSIALDSSKPAEELDLEAVIKGITLDIAGLSITEKILKHDWMPSMRELNAMTLEQLKEVNAASDAKKAMLQEQDMRQAHDNTITFWDSTTDEWKDRHYTSTGVVTTDTAFIRKDGVDRWNPKKQCWE